MNRENKKKSYKKVIINHTPAMKVLPARYAADLLCQTVQEVTTATTALTVLRVCTLILNRVIVRLTAEEQWNPLQYGCAKTANGQLFTAVKSAEH